ncbi:MAG: hypothetical protein WAR59_12890 [Ignavibacteriaceae bacterium]
MEDFIVNLIVNVLLMGMAIISVKDLITNKSHKKNIFKRINKVGYFLIFIALVSILFNLYKDYNADTKQKLSDKNKSISDSLLQSKQLEMLLLQNSIKDTIINKVDSTYKNSIKSSNEALAKYNLVITDSLRAVINKLKLESSKPQLVMYALEQGYQPAFLSEKDSVDIFNIQFFSIGGTCYDIVYDCYLLEDNGVLLQKYDMRDGDFLTEGIRRTELVKIKKSILQLDKVIVFLYGSFSKDPGGEYKVNYNEAFLFNFRDNKYISKADIDYDKIKKILGIK